MHKEREREGWRYITQLIKFDVTLFFLLILFPHTNKVCFRDHCIETSLFTTFKDSRKKILRYVLTGYIRISKAFQNKGLDTFGKPTQVILYPDCHHLLKNGGIHVICNTHLAGQFKCQLSYVRSAIRLVHPTPGSFTSQKNFRDAGIEPGTSGL